MSIPSGRRDPAARFPTTCWSRVVAAGSPHAPGAGEAMERLAHAHCSPSYASPRRRGHAPEGAPALVQALSAALLPRQDLGALGPDRGRFPPFLLAACTHSLANR